MNYKWTGYLSAKIISLNQKQSYQQIASRETLFSDKRTRLLEEFHDEPKKQAQVVGNYAT